ncbi:hypothetical protein ORIO_12580 [Cereibacter azotoformans]|uniref:hypothetical protein n=1 Tax=Cereibacter azotoformans TaxID=43057 RepID=UPI001EEAFA05|nr:hypothetical protein [Cereibacter azotoformans]ULB10739.1 hypothetical protein ORIO_12580 [Cereibacter azotoformans]
MSMSNVGAMRATLGLDVSQFENKAQSASRTAKQMSDAMARAFEVAKGAAMGGARSFEELRASIDPTFAATQRYAAIQRELAGMVESGAASQRAANMVLEQAAAKYMGVETAAARTARAQREGTAAIESAARGYTALRAQVDPLYAASKRYEQALETLNAAQAAGVIGDQERARTLKLLDAQMIAADHATTAAARGIGKFTPAITNASFQVQDFAIQIASGQSAMIAFTQQAPQLLGAFGFSGKLALLTAGIGTLIAVGGALVPMFQSMAAGTAGLQDKIDDLTKSVDGYKSAAERANKSAAELATEFGRNAQRAREAYAALRDLSALKAVEDLRKAMEGLGDAIPTSFGLIMSRLDATGRVGAQAAANLKAQFGLTADEGRRLAAAINAVGEATGPEEAAKRASELHRTMIAVFGSVEEIPPKFRDIARLAAEGNVAALQFLATMNGLTGSISSAASEAARLASNIVSASISAERESSRQLAIINAQLGAVRAGQDEVVAGKLKALDLDRQAYEQALKISGLSASEARLAAELNDAKQRAVVLAEEDLRAAQKARAELEKATTGGARAAAAEAKALDKSAQKYLEMLDPMEKYRRKKAELKKLLDAGKISADQYRQALAEIAAEMGENNPVFEEFRSAVGSAVDWMLDGFKGGFKGLLDIAKNTLKQIISMFLTNRITLSLGLGVSGGFAGAAAAGAASSGMGTAGMALSGASLMSNIGAGVSGFIGGITGPLQAGLSAAMQGGLSAGVKAWSASMNFGASGAAGTAGMLGTYFGAGMMGLGIGGLLSGGYSAIGSNPMIANGIGTAIGMAIAGPLGGIIGGALGGVTNALFGRKLKDTGIEGRYSGGDFAGNSYQFYKGGVFRSNKTKRSPLDDATAAAMDQTLDGLRISVGGMASILGEAPDALEKFTTSFKLSLKGLSAEEAQAKIAEQMEAIGEEMVTQIYGVAKTVTETNPMFAIMRSLGRDIPGVAATTKTVYELTDEFKALQIAGETAVETLTRLTTSLTTVNAIMDTLGHDFEAVGLTGADAAHKIAEAFGGLDAMAQATTAYYQAFYSESERLATLTRQTTEALAGMGIIMPQTRTEYRRMIEALDLTTDRGREVYAALIGLAGAMDQILPSVANLTAELTALVGAISTDLDGMISEASNAQRAAAQAAKGWYQVTLSLRSYILDLRSAASELISPKVAAAQSQARYQTTLASAMAGDQDAAKSITGIATGYVDAVRAQAGSALEVARAQARVLSDLQLLQGVTGLEGAKEDVLATLYGQQVDLLTEVRDYLAGGGVLKPAHIDRLNAKLGGLEGAIAAAKEISYAALRERIDVTVGLLATADIPADLRRILKGATSGVEVSLDMVLRRMDLSPDLVWIAAKKSSDHLARISYLATTDALPDDLRKLAAVRVAQSVRKLALVMDKPASDLGMAELLKAIGAKDGKITLGGSFSFDPSKGFSTWYEGTTRTTITAPMTALRTSLTDLAAAVRAETARANAAALKTERMAALSGYAENLASNTKGTTFATAAQVEAMARKAGISTAGKTAQQLAKEVAAFSETDGIKKVNVLPSSLTAYLFDVLKSRGGNIPLDKADYLRLYPDVAADEFGYDPNIHYRNHGRAAILAGLRPFKPEVFDWSAIGLNVPGFAAGGLHAGGLRLVGEQGPELEVTGPSRIYSASQTRDMLGQRETVAELRAMREELARMRSENTQLALRIEANTYTSASIARREERRTLSET